MYPSTSNTIAVSHREGHLTTYSINDLEEAFEITYTPQLTFEDYRVEQFIRKKCQQAKKLGKVEPHALFLGTLYRNALATHHIPDISISWIDKQIGYGLFSNQPMRKWAFVGEYAGLLRRRHLFKSNVNDYCFMYPRRWLTLKAYTIDSLKHGNYTRFINHSDTPNLESLSLIHDGIFRIVFRATRAIQAGDQLTYDYGDIYWNHREKVSLETNIVGHSRLNCF